MSPSTLTIATRESRLALWQAEHVRAALQKLYPSCDVRLLGMTTRGDVILDRSLSKVGGKGLFVKELEVALLEGKADLAVHSLKDVPMQLEQDFTLAAIMQREDPRDALVCAASSSYTRLDQLPAGSVVGTSSLRRQMQLCALYPHLKIEPLRGNLDTRLGKLDSGQYAAIVLAAAGLKRLGLANRITDVLPTTEHLPAAGQGALGIECLSSRTDVQGWLKPLHDEATAQCVLTERAVSRALGGSCSVPLAAYAQQTTPGMVHLDAMLGLPDASQVLRVQANGVASDALALQVVDQLYDQGAAQVMELLKLNPLV